MNSTEAALRRVANKRLLPHQWTLKNSRSGKVIVDCSYWLEAYEERAAIRQYDGNMSKQQAERQAIEDIRKEAEEGLKGGMT